VTKNRTARTPAWLMFAALAAFGLAALAVLVTVKQQADVAAGAKVPAAQTKTVRIPIQGMVCTVCAGKVKRALRALDGVQEVEVSLERREARVRYGEGKVSPEQLVAAISKLGYNFSTGSRPVCPTGQSGPSWRPWRLVSLPVESARVRCRSGLES
jgi:copper chaperone